MRNIVIAGITIALPSALQQTETDEELGDTTFATYTHEAEAQVSISVADEDEALSYENPESIVDMVHHVLTDSRMGNAGIVDVASGTTGVHGRDWAYYIVRIVNVESGQVAAYMLDLNIYFDGTPVQFSVITRQTDRIGVREHAVWQIAVLNGIIGEDGEGWSHDPFDEAFTYGAPMNLSETLQFDRSYPEHALSLARSIANSITSHN